MESILNIGFWNCQGLNFHKWNKIAALIDASFDIIFLAETWFVNQSSHTSHPLFLATSRRIIPNPNPTGHAQAGLICLISPLLRPLVSQVKTTEYTITITLQSHTIMAVYFPPSMSGSNLIKYLPVQPVTLILGDINTHFGAAYGSRRIGPRNRIDIFEDMALRFGLDHLPPSPPQNTPDHAFCRYDITAKWTFLPDLMKGLSDHIFMAAQLHLQITPSNSSSDSIKFFLKPLEKSVIQKLLIQEYSIASTTLQKSWGILDGLTPSSPIGHISSAIDVTYTIFYSMILSICETYLGTYSVHSVRSLPNHSEKNILQKLNSTSAPQKAATLLKLAQRYSQPDVIINSRDPTLSAVDDATQYYQEVFDHPSALNSQNCYVPEYGNNMPDLLSNSSWFTTKSISSVIKKYPSSKSAGPDPLHIKILKVLARNEDFLTDLQSFFHYCLKLGYTPSHWNTSHIHPIPKKTSSFTIDDFRPVALTPMLRRIFEACLLKSLQFSRISQFHPSQAGFRSGFSTITHSIISHDAFQLLGTDKRPDRVFIDLKQAYDRVVIPLLMKKLKLLDASDQMLKIIHSLFSQCYSTISINGVISSPFPRHRGLFQGSLLSPMLFNVYIDDLAKNLNPADSLTHQPSALLFADDIQLLPKSLPHASHMLQTISLWCSANGMEVNTSKSAYIGPNPDWNLTLNGSLLPTPVSYSYLGLPTILGGIDWDSYTTNCESKASKCLTYLQVKGSRWPPLIRLQLFRAFIRSRWEYAAPMMLLASPKEAIQRIQNLQLKALGWVVSASDHHSKQYQRLIQSLTGIESVADRFETLGIRFGLHYATSSPSNPLKLMAHAITNNQIFANTKSLIRKQIHRPKGYLQYVAENSKKPPEEQISLTMAMSQRKIINISKISTRKDRIALISKDSRHEKTGADVSIYMKNRFFANQAIRWRMNTLCIGSKCPICHKHFYFTHADKCFGFKDTDALFQFHTQKALIQRLSALISAIRPEILPLS